MKRRHTFFIYFTPILIFKSLEIILIKFLNLLLQNLTMVTLEQIQEAQSKVKTGKDFPQLVSDLKDLGIRIFETQVATGETIFYDFENNQVTTPPLFEPLKISLVCQIAKFREILRTHQEGNSDFITFCQEVAEAGIDKWLVDVNKMKCIYFDRNGTLIFEEEIPE